MTKRSTAAALVLVCTALIGVSRAEDKADPTGTWKWSVTVNGNTRENTLKLKLDGDKLTGTMLNRNNEEVAIDDAKFKDNEVSFSYTRERNGNKFTTTYRGKIDGDTIKGTSESERDGQKQSRDWEPKREKK